MVPQKFMLTGTNDGTITPLYPLTFSNTIKNLLII